ncbi:MAG: transcription-repair coupling factor [Lachnospiraceae bacterium]|nr:transcription-repair coupling factor [Lachnospiraceae bacterium]
MKTYTEPMRASREFEAVEEHLRRGETPVLVTGCTPVQKAQFMYAAGAPFRYRLIIAEDDLKAKLLYEDYREFDPATVYMPDKDLIFFSAGVQGNATLRARMEVLRRMAETKEQGGRLTVVTTIRTGLERLQPLEEILEARMAITRDTEISPTDLGKRLAEMSYRRTEQVETAGEYAIRGGILDVFPISQSNPYRIEFWGDSIDDIKVFDAASQRSIEPVDGVTIYPAVELVLSETEREDGLARMARDVEKTAAKLDKEKKYDEAHHLRVTGSELADNIRDLPGSVNLGAFIDYFKKNTTSFFSYFPKEETVVFLDEPTNMAENAEAAEAEYTESMEARLAAGSLLPGQLRAINDDRRVFAELAAMRTVAVATFVVRDTLIDYRYQYDLGVRAISSYGKNLEALAKDLAAYKKKGYRMLLVSPSHTRARNLVAELEEHGVISFYTEDPDRVVGAREVMIVYGKLRCGFEYPLLKFVVITESDIFGRERAKVERKKSNRKALDYRELANGDYVIHENNGVGIYRGLVQMTTDGVTKDYVKVEYEGGNCYVPATGLDVLQKYADADIDKKPKVSRLGGTEWKKTKAKVQKSVNNIAQELINLYAIRQSRKGFAYSEDKEWQREFEERFPFEETDDQLRAIADTKRDMESERIMDRLICGDVGYGKTEIALRAAFKAVLDGKQVAVLVPTTILAQQHYNTFSQRLMDFPCRVDMLSRFRSKTEQERTVADIRKGLVDIVIGTHRILSKDVQFKNLGLLIVDEEQRFGVTHKEKIKQLRNDVDALTLTATPIPRTLHMSLIGIRDMSILEEPPLDRLPIQTFVMEFSPEIAREAINRELAREGQVYYIYNRVNGISEKAAQIQELCPDANVAYAHGQMNERELEKIMTRFINREIDVLVSTTIVETGMDISNVNTMIIDGAERLGLSQMYQLRGRVGRSNRIAYAFLMYHRDKILTETAEKRLKAIRDYTELGAGYRISLRDLEIRGAGNLLGAEQHGQIATVGYELYCKMLNEAIRAMKGDTEVREMFETQIDADLDAYIPATYIRNEIQKLDMYKRIASIESAEDLEELQDELTDRFGDMPECVDLLLRVAYLKALAHKAYVEKLTIRGGFLVMRMFANANLRVEEMPDVVAQFGSRLHVQAGKDPVFTYAFSGGKNAGDDLKSEFREAENVLTALGTLAE